MHTTSYHVAFWPLDEPAGSTVAGDLTGNGHYGTLSAGVVAGAAGPPTGDGDTAMAFHGADQVTVASMAGLPAGAHPYSLEAWVDMAGGGGANEGLVGYGNYGAGLQADVLRTNGWAGLDNYWWGDDLWANGSASLIGGWHLAVATYDGHGRRLYLAGAPFAADAPASRPAVQLLNLALGQTGGGDYLTGSLANVAIYPYALSPAQVGRHRPCLRSCYGGSPPLCATCRWRDASCSRNWSCAAPARYATPASQSPHAPPLTAAPAPAPPPLDHDHAKVVLMGFGVSWLLIRGYSCPSILPSTHCSRWRRLASSSSVSTTGSRSASPTLAAPGPPSGTPRRHGGERQSRCALRRWMRWNAEGMCRVVLDTMDKDLPPPATPRRPVTMRRLLRLPPRVPPRARNSRSLRADIDMA